MQKIKLKISCEYLVYHLVRFQILFMCSNGVMQASYVRDNLRLGPVDL